MRFSEQEIKSDFAAMSKKDLLLIMSENMKLEKVLKVRLEEGKDILKDPDVVKHQVLQDKFNERILKIEADIKYLQMQQREGNRAMFYK